MSRNSVEWLDHLLRQRREAAGGSEPLLRSADVLEALRAVPSPTRSAVAAGRRAFLSEAASLREEMQATRGSQKRGYRSWAGLPAFSRALAGVMLGLLLATGLGYGISAAGEQAPPGSPLYSLKIAYENARLAFTSDPRARGELNLAYADRRVEEVAALALDDKVIPVQVLNRLEVLLQTALENASQMPDAEMQQLLEHIRQRTQEQARTMEQLMLRASEPPQEGMHETLRLLTRTRERAELGLGNPDAFRLRLRQGEDRTPPPVGSPGASPDATGTPAPTHEPTQRRTAPGTGTRAPNPTTGGPTNPVPSKTPQPGGPGGPWQTPEPTGHGGPWRTPEPTTPAGPHTGGGNRTPQPANTPGGASTPGPDETRNSPGAWRE